MNPHYGFFFAIGLYGRRFEGLVRFFEQTLLFGRVAFDAIELQ